MSPTYTPAITQPTQRLVQRIATELTNGRDEEQLVRALRRRGWEAAEARRLVRDVERALQAPDASDVAEAPRSGRSATGLIVWIGMLLGINVLSLIFDWPFWVY